MLSTVKHHCAGKISHQTTLLAPFYATTSSSACIPEWLPLSANGMERIFLSLVENERRAVYRQLQLHRSQYFLQVKISKTEMLSSN